MRPYSNDRLRRLLPTLGVGLVVLLLVSGCRAPTAPSAKAACEAKGWVYVQLAPDGPYQCQRFRDAPRNFQ